MDVTMFAIFVVDCLVALPGSGSLRSGLDLESHSDSDSFRHKQTMLRKRTIRKNSEMVIGETFGVLRRPPS